MAVLGADDAQRGAPGASAAPGAPGAPGRDALHDPEALRAWAVGARAASAAARERVDAVNVFPVADADTGSNVHLTLAGGADAVARTGHDADAAAVARALATGAAEAARGSSGVIVSQWLGGLAAAVDAGADLATALGRAASAARAAVADPQEGTVLTVAGDVAREVARATSAGTGHVDALTAATAAARADLGRVSAGHEVLRAARVVDAGACALLVLLDALAHALRTRTPAAAADLDLSWLPADGPSPAVAAAHAHGGDGAYEVVLQVVPGPGGTDAPSADADALAQALGGVGDAVAVAAVGGRLHAHVHTDDPAAALALVPAPQRAQVVVRTVDARGDDGAALVVLTPSPGLAAWYATAGAVTLVAEPGTVVTPAHVDRAVTDAGEGPVLVLDAAAALPATVPATLPATVPATVPGPVPPDGAPGDATRRLVVLPVPSDGPAVVACLAVLAEPEAGARAARAVLHRLREARLPADPAATDPPGSGDAGGAPHTAVEAAVAALVLDAPEAQSVTLVHGAGAPPAAVDATAAAVRAAHPEQEVVVVGPAAQAGWWVGVD
ncbi:DAK2 domain-containing protein [Cellulomonas sp. JZ18]|uniref:DAK2 domain-containing protein n=1 Tax=Cellulomonas sp. JZ18 TaxID=2654191 RepID=UPI0012D4282E|nr:DAK2 domain-containing protein [Cellulomonas sp. JZ18]QGQ18930.1 DAK2 domain-containing protein [Cellulomonas sp. JZ18]